MKRSVLVALGLLLATSASAEKLFIGTIRVTAATAPCQYFEGPGRTFNSTFHQNSAGNANFSAISFIDKYYGIGYSLNGQAFNATFKNVVSGGIGWGDPFSWTGSQVRIISLQVLFANTPNPQLVLRGQVKKPQNDPGGVACVIDFSGSYVGETQ